jgi:hypothetical protein
MAMQQLETVGPDDLVHSDSQCQIVGRKFKQRIPANVDLVEKNARKK